MRCSARSDRPPAQVSRSVRCRSRELLCRRGNTDVSNAVATARRTVRMEGEAILAAGERLDDAGSPVRGGACSRSSGRVIVSGIGKSGVIAQKIAATLTSTGTAASYVHPIESLHGDLWLVDRHSVAIILTKSGETEELFGLLGALVRLGVPIVAITGARESTLGRAARFVLDASVQEEACPHDLAPTTSTAVALALGDGVAMALLEQKGFARADFAALHPGGRLGRKLFLRVADVMVPADAMLAWQRMQRCSRWSSGWPTVAVSWRSPAAVRCRRVITAGDLTRIAERTPVSRLASRVGDDGSASRRARRRSCGVRPGPARAARHHGSAGARYGGARRGDRPLARPAPVRRRMRYTDCASVGSIGVLAACKKDVGIQPRRTAGSGQAPIRVFSGMTAEIVRANGVRQLRRVR